ncbi:phosphopantetheine-binding protein, partial [Pseudoalteromonas luteoviolacea]|uniref:phosphopantetheine-binding protein n=1 Tax=Pseudoalteromonas luteoviolacea TaxID=43657 RepID=UPI000AA36CC3
FDLGGHSLLLTRLVSKIQERFAIDTLSVKDLFESQTISDQAVEISYQQSMQVIQEQAHQLVEEEW